MRPITRIVTTLILVPHSLVAFCAAAEVPTQTPAETKPSATLDQAAKEVLPNSAPSAIHVFPEDVSLLTKRDRQAILVQAEFPDGTTRDITAEAKYSLSSNDITNFQQYTFTPKQDGQCELKVEYGGHTKTIPINIAKATAERPISFQLDIMPVFMKAGCNTGSCHGAARGKDGFRLSLFGFDPKGDHTRLTTEIPGRRINLAIPEKSLLMEKAVGAVPHTGGKKFGTDSEYYHSLIRWLKADAAYDSGEVPVVTQLELYPKHAVLNGKGATQKLIVRAQYSDGTNRDVSNLAYFASNNDNSATVTQEGVVTAENRGEAFITARFETHTVGVHFITLPKDLNYEWTEVAENNYIDTLLHQKFRKLRIHPSELCTDEEFLRRVFIDITGTLPNSEEYNRFVNDKSAGKRDKLIDELLERKEFVEIWVMKWAEMLRIRSQNNNPTISYKSALTYYNWVKERIAANTPWDDMVRELLSSTGGTFTNPATNYYENEQDTLKVAENVAQVFMGTRIQCAQCHNHPFDRWTMDDYYGFSAFFSQIGRKPGEDSREKIIYNRGGGEVKHPVDNRVMAPKFLGGDTPDVKGKDRRAVMAAWLASGENPYFAPNLSNIIWAHFFGKGIIDEVDDVRVSNPPSNQELLDSLASHLVDYEFDFKQLVRDICRSRAYQASTKPTATNAFDNRNFARASLRRMRAEVMLDAVAQLTNHNFKFRGLPLGARAVQIADGSTSDYFLTTFGRARRDTVCSCEVKTDPNLSQALHLLNGNSVHDSIVKGKVVDGLCEGGQSPEQVVDELYIRCLSRKPTEKERKSLAKILAEDADEKEQKLALNDVFWGLLNSSEFMFNH
ncbi:DUF1549 domain-containing protein [Calycomorphotria hydatis]|uniref:Bacterial Ig-like domain (Group 2) n=1 Tax=Calycomorphotria hydatis TaxID=2528027 RepID=A0A517T987_9PLAN|nr:DUF1549 domain-containing protein [Calycomorphotria hydatis]QDT64930.1 Bacterial Ig-like domain (group 2) [Calycomorphotria hydatis]